MKNIVSRLIVITGLFAAPFAFSAEAPEQSYLDSYRGRTDMPVPLKVVTPTVSQDFAGQTVRVEFLIDASGVPQRITVANQTPARLAEAVTGDVGQWRFQPMTRNGQAVPAHIILPLSIVDSEN